jgi:hypothetical protein
MTEPAKFCFNSGMKSQSGCEQRSSAGHAQGGFDAGSVLVGKDRELGGESAGLWAGTGEGGWAARRGGSNDVTRAGRRVRCGHWAKGWIQAPRGTGQAGRVPGGGARGEGVGGGGRGAGWARGKRGFART